MSANDRQIGGDHYKNGQLEHWDMIERYHIGYLEGCASKYVSRWRNKNGLQDLEKSLHYCQKIRELAAEGRQPRGFVPIEVIDQFTVVNKLNAHEHIAMLNLLRWRTVDNIEVAEQHIRSLYNSAL